MSRKDDEQEPAVDGEAIAERLAEVRRRIDAAARSAGRDPSEVTLVAVSKTMPAAAVAAAWAAGQRVFGENYVQELAGKAAALGGAARDAASTVGAPPGLVWRFIGHLQRNKAKDVVRVGATVDTVDSLRLADALVRRIPEGSPPQEVLVEVNIGREPQKAGVLPEDLPSLLAGLAERPTLRCRGLLAVPPAADDPEASRPHFRRLAELAQTAGPSPLPELSMGMTHDFEIAIAEGATMVRLGTAIFGARPPKT